MDTRDIFDALPYVPLKEFDQTALIDLMYALGYSLNQNGVCAGITAMWLQAFLVGEEEKFTLRINLLASIYYQLYGEFAHEFAESCGQVGRQNGHDREEIIYVRERFKTALQAKFAAIQAKIKSDHGLRHVNDFEMMWLEIKSFFEGVELYQNPGNFYFLFDALLNQVDLPLVNQFVLSKKMERRGGIVKLGSECWLCAHRPQIELDIFGDDSELRFYFKELTDLLKEIKKLKRVAFTMSSINHMIGLRYEPEHETWVLIDSNHLPPKHVLENEIHKEIYHALRRSWMQDLAFNISLYTTAHVKDTPEVKQLEQAFNKFKQRHQVSHETIVRNKENDNMLAFLAARHGDIEKLCGLAKAGLNLNSPMLIKYVAQKKKEEGKHYESPSPISMLAHSGKTEALCVLAKQGISLDEVDLNEFTPFCYAVRGKRWHTAMVILQHIRPSALKKESRQAIDGFVHLKLNQAFLEDIKPLSRDARIAKIRSMLNKENALGVVLGESMLRVYLAQTTAIADPKKETHSVKTSLPLHSCG